MTARRILVTGAAGFVGSWMADYLCKQHPTAEIYGLVRQGRRPAASNLDLARVRWVECDLDDSMATQEAMASICPDLVFHLAAKSNVPEAWRAPQSTLACNILGQVNLFEALRDTQADPTIVLAGSSDAYGLVDPSTMPITEATPFRPTNPYAVSKATQDLLGWQYYHAHGLKVLRMRPFNHTGPGRGDRFMESSFARQIACIEAGLMPPILRVGNLEAQRDFSDVRDVVAAYDLAAQHGHPGEAYNVASGVARPVREVLDLLLEAAKVQVTVEIDPARLRPADVLVVQGDASKLRAATGWSPRIPLAQTLRDLLEHWRLEVRRSS